MPVNLKMVFEGMEESGSNGLEEVVVAEAKSFLSDVDAVCISDVRSLISVLGERPANTSFTRTTGSAPPRLASPTGFAAWLTSPSLSTALVLISTLVSSVEWFTVCALPDLISVIATGVDVVSPCRAHDRPLRALFQARHSSRRDPHPRNR